jgi:hypothetical protein
MLGNVIPVEWSKSSSGSRTDGHPCICDSGIEWFEFLKRNRATQFARSFSDIGQQEGGSPIGAGHLDLGVPVDGVDERQQLGFICARKSGQEEELMVLVNSGIVELANGSFA